MEYETDGEAMDENDLTDEKEWKKIEKRGTETWLCKLFL